mmetsp:Transcript_47723/g.76952  ORF Transcript_47723/g.76952 Transcript_47723/m.76952 type:complete len:256 (+) Transcript_47723:471-1238(+)
MSSVPGAIQSADASASPVTPRRTEMFCRRLSNRCSASLLPGATSSGDCPDEERWDEVRSDDHSGPQPSPTFVSSGVCVRVSRAVRARTPLTDWAAWTRAATSNHSRFSRPSRTARSTRNSPVKRRAKLPSTSNPCITRRRVRDRCARTPPSTASHHIAAGAEAASGAECSEDMCCTCCMPTKRRSKHTVPCIESSVKLTSALPPVRVFKSARYGPSTPSTGGAALLIKTPTSARPVSAGRSGSCKVATIATNPAM